MLAGITSSCIALLAMALISEGWQAFIIMPVLALAGTGTPVLQALATRLVDEHLQGQFQGVLAAIMSIASIIGPLIFRLSILFFVLTGQVEFGCQRWP